MSGLPGFDRTVVLLPDTRNHDELLCDLPDTRYHEELHREAREAGLAVECFCPAETSEQPFTNKPDRWGIPDGKGIETWVGSAFAKAVEKYRWDGIVLVPLEHLLVDRAGVAESLQLHIREGFDVTFSEDRVPGAGWAILDANLLKGMQASHPDLMAARGGLLWALQKPLYPFKIGAFHAPRDRSPLAADLRLNRERVAHVFAEAGGQDFAEPGFQYGRWIRGRDWQRVYTDYAPETVRLEPTNTCRGGCAGCPQAAMKRPPSFLDGHVFDRVAQDFVPVSDCRWILSGMGEPLLHAGLPAFLERLRGRPVRLETSLSEEMGRDFPWSALTQVRLSVDALERTGYEILRPNCSWEHIERFISEAAARKAKRPDDEPDVGVSLVKHVGTDAFALPFLRYWKQVCTPIFRKHFFTWPISSEPDKVQWFQILGASDYFGTIPRPGAVRYTPLNRRTCLHGTLGFHVLSDGRVTMCPFDIEGRWAFGSMAGEGGAEALDIWHGSAARAFREMHLTGQFEDSWPCGACQDWYHPQ
ncbi:MAG: radical SAM/SPASM domain-containing protein [Candidatus Ozemobacteraceae bacterium]